MAADGAGVPLGRGRAVFGVVVGGARGFRGCVVSSSARLRAAVITAGGRAICLGGDRVAGGVRQPLAASVLSF